MNMVDCLLADGAGGTAYNVLKGGGMEKKGRETKRRGGVAFSVKGWMPSNERGCDPVTNHTTNHTE